MSKIVTLKPRMSEKAYGLSQVRNNYAFIVPIDANKLTVAQSVAVQFGVTVLTVTIMNVKGKPKRTVKKGGRPSTGARSTMKKAYVTLKSGDSIPIFAAEEKVAARKVEMPCLLAARRDRKIQKQTRRNNHSLHFSFDARL